MIVSDLIEKLQSLDQFSEVMLHIPDGDSDITLYTVTDVEGKKAPFYDGEGGKVLARLPVVILSSDEYNG